MSPASSKIALFIDGANLYATAKRSASIYDYKRLLKEFQSRGTLLRAFYLHRESSKIRNIPRSVR